MEAIEITVRFDKDGRADPVSFSWNGQPHRIAHTGRRWTAEDGEHILVMDPSGRMFELMCAYPDKRWYLANASPGGARV